MSEKINIRPISELAEVEAISEGDKLLLKSGDEAKLIDARKIGGGGGGGTVYIDILSINDDMTEMSLMCFKDEAHTQPLTFAEGKQLLISGAGLYGTFTMGGLSVPASINCSQIIWGVLAENAGTGIFTNIKGALSDCVLLFSDTPTDG